MPNTTVPSKDVFFDVHCHTMNLAHPCLYAFLKRFLKVPNNPLITSAVGAGAGFVTGLLAPLFGKPFLNKHLNHLSIMERNVARIHMAMEDDLPPELKIGTKKFERVSITPLLMDFWSDEQARGIYYQFTPKSIIPQVLDVLNGIADFANTVRGDEYSACIDQFAFVAEEGRQIGPDNQWRVDLRRLLKDDLSHEDKERREEALKKFGPNRRKMVSFPFMGLNTTYCFLTGVKRTPRESTNLNRLLDDYFGSSGTDPFTGTYESLCGKFGEFDGSLKKNKRNFFAGIKVYPPLGFDPWPEPGPERDKVVYLYQFCIDRGVPITSHCSDGGFKVGDPAEAVKRSDPKKWKAVLENESLKNLKLNLAHFGGMNSGLRYEQAGWKQPFLNLRHGGDPKWVMTIIDLLKKYPNVYTDISYSGVSDKFYKALKRMTGDHEEIKDKLLFGSDFTINLLSIEHYNEYLNKFLETQTLADDLKLKMCNENPRRFLFNSDQGTLIN